MLNNDQPLVVLDTDGVPSAGTSSGAIVGDALTLSMSLLDQDTYGDCHRLIHAAMSEQRDTFPFIAAFSLAIVGHHVVGSLLEQLAEHGVPNTDAIKRVVASLTVSSGSAN